VAWAWDRRWERVGLVGVVLEVRVPGAGTRRLVGRLLCVAAVNNQDLVLLVLRDSARKANTAIILTADRLSGADFTLR